MRSFMKLNFPRKLNDQYKRRAISASNGPLLVFLGEFALQEVFYQRLEEALREEVLELRLKLFEHFLHDGIDGLRIGGCSPSRFGWMREEVRWRREERNLREGLAVVGRSSGNALIDLRLGRLRFEQRLSDNRTGRTFRRWRFFAICYW